MDRDPETTTGSPLVQDRAAALVRELLAAGERVELRLAGGSMAPFLRPGDVVVLAPIAAGGLAAGDVVAFLAGSRIVIHRLLAVRRGGGLHARGDAAPSSDRVDEAQILGRVVEARRSGRRLRLGLGPERRLLAWLSARGWLARRR